MSFSRRRNHEKKFTANYSHSNHNFVIQNLEGERIESEYLPAICILKNILQRGKPTLLSTFLQEKLGAIHKGSNFEQPYPLIDTEPPKWERTIRGDEKGNYYPAKKFYEELIPKYLPEFRFIQQLLIPEVPINEITQVDVDGFDEQQVDFYLPQAYLIIEIDGSHHEEEEQKGKDNERDIHTNYYDIQTIRIKTSDLEEENTVFLEKIESIEKRIRQEMEGQKKRKENGNKPFIGLDDYKTSFENGIDLSNPHYQATAIMRFQILLLELLEHGHMDFKKPWQFEVFERDAKDFAEPAIEDLIIWLEHLFNLQNVDFKKPKTNIKKVVSQKEFSIDKEVTKIDFSLLKRHTDEFQTHEEVIFVRTDYLDEFKHFRKGSFGNLRSPTIEPYDHFRVSICKEKVKYDLDIGEESSQKESLRFFLWNIFLQSSLNFDTCEFREGQLPIIANALSRNDTIGLLPTGAGKSACYQLAAILQPAISLVVCPLISLMQDQKDELDSAYFTRTNHITSDEPETKEKRQEEFGEKRYLFIFISPERLQRNSFRKEIDKVNKDIAYAVIDEIHCLSEWGHTFRFSYLNLVKTIRNKCPDSNFIGLTATSSLKVLKDIKVELSISNEDNIKTIEDYTRNELKFDIVDDNGKKYDELCHQINLLNPIDTINVGGSTTKCGLIFTPAVDGHRGCYKISQNLGNIPFFSGKSPTKKIRNNDGTEKKVPIFNKKEFSEKKRATQKGFKENEFSLLVATNSFGMGMNKGNIHYTIHYGIPMSMEALYQEAGRAGRDKEKFADGEEEAQCIVLLDTFSNEQILQEIWDEKTQVSRLKELQKQLKGDLSTILYLFLLNEDTVTEQFIITKQLYKYITSNAEKNKTDTIKVNDWQIKYKTKEKNKHTGQHEIKHANEKQTEKAIYRLAQLGVIKDWTVNASKTFELEVADSNEQSIKSHLEKTIHQYNPNKSFKEIDKEYQENFEIEYTKEFTKVEETITNKCIYYLHQWTYDHLVHNRKQSLKDLYEYCLDAVEGRKTPEQFKSALEHYFQISPLSRRLGDIAESPRIPAGWFEVFHHIEEETFTDTFINEEEQENMKSTLGRFLKDYKDNAGLYMISGLIRLLLDDYENADGRNRLESALSTLRKTKDCDDIVDRILKVGSQMNDKNKVLLAGSIHKFIDKPDLLNSLSEKWGENFTRLMIEQMNRELTSIKERVYGGLREVG
ncbi:MAG: DEAD/DEAH box helicase [Thermodesulfobacteriota bacterium]